MLGRKRALIALFICVAGRQMRRCIRTRGVLPTTHMTTSPGRQTCLCICHCTFHTPSGAHSPMFSSLPPSTFSSRPACGARSSATSDSLLLRRITGRYIHVVEPRHARAVRRRELGNIGHVQVRSLRLRCSPPSRRLAETLAIAGCSAGCCKVGMETQGLDTYGHSREGI